jgi:hemolysin III
MTTNTATRLRPVDIGKPRLRGWIHAYACGVAIVGGIVLCAVAATRPGGWAPLISCVIYSVAVAGLFGTSALYHRRVWSERSYRLMRRLDHSMIFVLIAGTYTPFCVLLLSQRAATFMLVVVWSGALAGVAMAMIWPYAPRWVSAPLYLALGWVAIGALPDFLHSGGIAVFALLAVGGVAYSVGALFYALRKPDPWPTIFGHHEFFHACTAVAAICHYIAVYFALYV